MRIAVLITVYNRRESTLRCLHDLFAQQLPSGAAIDVWLTDDGCTDGTPDAVRQQFPQVNIVQGDATLFWNRGMHRAWTAAAEHCPYDYYLWLNDDTFITSDCLATLLLASQQADDKSVIVGTTCRTDDDSVISYGGRLRAGGKPIVPNGQLQECSLINGNIVLIPRYVYDRVGTNDPVFRHAIGDHDYGLRAIRQGIKCLVAPKVVGRCDTHDRPETWCDPSVPLSKRWRALRRATGIQPEQFFIYTRRHKGLMSAIVVYLKIHMQCLTPRLWAKLKG